MTSLFKPQSKDLPILKTILSQWNDDFETQKYLERVKNEIDGQIEFDMRFWVLKEDGIIVGMGGLSNCQPKLKPFIQTDASKELKTIYLDKLHRSKGYGRKLIKLLQDKAVDIGYKELLLVSAEKYKETAYGFYKKMGFQHLGEVDGGEVDKKMAVFSKLLIE